MKITISLTKKQNDDLQQYKSQKHKWGMVTNYLRYMKDHFGESITASEYIIKHYEEDNT